jgi:membrane protease YdiL (CAAX protease family)
LNSERKKILIHVLAVLSITTIVMVGFAALHVTDNWAANALMCIPGIVTLVMLLANRDGFGAVGWSMGRPIVWCWALLLPLLTLAVWLPTSLALGCVAKAAAGTKGAALIADPCALLANAGFYLAISLPLAFGEEFGWRGYLQRRLVSEFGVVNGLVMLGLVWGFWHTPIFYVMGTYPEQPVLGPFVMAPIDNLLAVSPMAWLYIRSKSIWVPTFTHAFADILWGFAGLLFPSTSEVGNWVVLQFIQLAISIVLLRALTARPADAC